MDVIYALALIGVAVAIGVPVGIVRSRRSKGSGKKGQAAEPVYFDFSDDDNLPDEQQVIDALEARSAVWHVGKIARATASQLGEGAAAKERLVAIIDSRFEPGSITNDKFMAPVQVAYRTLVRNSAELSNRVQDFDGRELSRMRRLMRDDAYKHDDVPDEIQEARWAAMSSDYASIQSLATANELIVAELTKLEKQLQTLSDTNVAADSIELAAELDELSSHVVRYR